MSVTMEEVMPTLTATKVLVSILETNNTSTFIPEVTCELIEELFSGLGNLAKTGYDNTTRFIKNIPKNITNVGKNIKDIYPSLNILLKTLNEVENPIELLVKIPNIGQQKATKIIEFLL
jgi:ERCC4-type nuclease